MPQFKTIGSLCDQLVESDELMARFKADPLPWLLQLNLLETRRIHNDTFIYRCVVIVLCLILISIVGFSLAVNGKIAYEHLVSNTEIKPFPLPEYVIAIGSTALGALAGLLAPSPANNADNN